MKILVACVHCVLYVALVGFCLYAIDTMPPHARAIAVLPGFIIAAFYSNFLTNRYIVPQAKPTRPEHTTIAAE